VTPHLEQGRAQLGRVEHDAPVGGGVPTVLTTKEASGGNGQTCPSLSGGYVALDAVPDGKNVYARDYRRARALLDLLESSARVESERPVRLLARPPDRLRRQDTQSVEPTIATTNVPSAQKMSAHDEGPALGANGKSTSSK
jgi:hypothetical protein